MCFPTSQRRAVKAAVTTGGSEHSVFIKCLYFQLCLLYFPEQLLDFRINISKAWDAKKKCGQLVFKSSIQLVYYWLCWTSCPKCEFHSLFQTVG